MPFLKIDAHGFTPKQGQNKVSFITTERASHYFGDDWGPAIFGMAQGESDAAGAPAGITIEGDTVVVACDWDKIMTHSSYAFDGLINGQDASCYYTVYAPASGDPRVIFLPWKEDMDIGLRAFYMVLADSEEQHVARRESQFSFEYDGWNHEDLFFRYLMKIGVMDDKRRKDQNDAVLHLDNVDEGVRYSVIDGKLFVFDKEDPDKRKYIRETGTISRYFKVYGAEGEAEQVKSGIREVSDKKVEFVES